MAYIDQILVVLDIIFHFFLSEKSKPKVYKNEARKMSNVSDRAN